MASELYSTSARNRSSLSRSAASAGWRSVRSTIVGAVRFAGFFGERAIGSMLGVPGGFARKSRARLGGRRQPAGSLQTARAQSGCGGGAPEAGLEPATRSLSEPGAPASERTADAPTGPDVPPVERPTGEKSFSSAPEEPTFPSGHISKD